MISRHFCFKTTAYLLVLPVFLLVFLPALTGLAKDAPLTAIMLFDGPSGPSYVQVTGVTLNAKTELRVCDVTAKIDKRSYDLLPRTQLRSGTAIERNLDGVLMLTSEGVSPACVVPSNLKFDKSPELTPAQAADQAVVQGLVAPPPTPGGEIPPLKPGVRLVFVPAPDPEFAEYLRAERARSIPVWEEFLKRYTASAHAGKARQLVAGLLEQSAESAISEYDKTASTHAPDIKLLKQAHNHAERSVMLAGPHAATQKLLQKIQEHVDLLVESTRRELQSYQKALAEHTSGYSHLVTASRQSEPVLEIDPRYPLALSLHDDVASEESKLETTLHNAEGLSFAKRYDEALNMLGPYRGMSAELPRIASIVKDVYNFHYARGQELSTQQNWEQASAEFRAAGKIMPDSKEVETALKAAEAQKATAMNRRFADQAVADSKGYAGKGDAIAAYEVLANLPDQQRVLVADQIEGLKRDYVVAASRRAQKLQEIHLPIRGRADEDAMRQACELLQRAGAMTGDPAVKLRLDLLSDKISSYYVDQARRYLQKPAGSGVGLGWLYLGEAQRYKPGLEAVKDEMARYQSAYQLRGRLSMGVVVRDQTSRRESVGFADQLGDAIANGLETSSLAVKVVRHYVEDPAAVQPDFVLVGEILEHRIVKNTNLETLPSKYRAGTHEVKNEAWVSASQAHALAQQELVQAQRALVDAQQHRKKDVPAATDAVDAAQKKVDQLHKQLDALNPTRPDGILEPYNYTKKTIDVTAVIDLAFRMTDQSGNVIEATTPIRREDHKTYVVLENVKPEDTEGIKQLNTAPDEVQFITDLELQARDFLVKSIKEKTLRLPEKILQQARKRAQQQDVDGAAEEYIIFLNSSADHSSPEHAEAAAFLRDHFNVAVEAVASPAKQTQVRPTNQ